MKKACDPEDTGLLIRECLAHRKSVTKLNKHSFNGIISIGQDYMVKVWSHGLDLWGVIDCRYYEQDKLWYFPSKDRKISEQNDLN